MKFKNIFNIAIFTLSVLLISCGVAEEEPKVADEVKSETKINVLATTPMIGEYVKEVAGDNINLTILMPPS